MCFTAEPKTKYYYHEEIIPARRHHHHHHHSSSSGHHHHGHHHHHHHSPRASYVSTSSRHCSPRVSTASYRLSGPVVYERRKTSQTSYV